MFVVFTTNKTMEDPMGITAAAAADPFRREPARFIDVGVGEVAYRTPGSGPDVRR